MSSDQLREKLLRLRSVLIEASDLAEVSDYFVMQLAADHEFIAAGEGRANPGLERVVRGSLRACFGEAPLDAFALLELPGHHFWHGAAAWQPDGVMLLLYFEQLDLGLISVAPSLWEGSVHFLRFSILPSSPGAYWVKGPRGLA